jgi:hypothetical protein
MPRERDAGWSNPRVLTIFAVIFLCGAAVGAVATRSFLHRRIPLSEVHGVPIENARRFGLQHLKEELNLTPDQENAIMRELDDYGKYYQNIEEERQDVAEHGRQHILDVLNSQQKKRFNEIFDSKAH